MSRYRVRYATSQQSLEGLYVVVDTKDNSIVSDAMSWDDAEAERKHRNAMTVDAELAPHAPMTWSL